MKNASSRGNIGRPYAKEDRKSIANSAIVNINKFSKLRKQEID